MKVYVRGSAKRARVIPDMPPIPCIECNANVMTLRESKNGLFYGCRGFPTCRGALSANPDGTPRGRPRTRAHQASRRAIHEEIARLAPGKRGSVYEWLAMQLDIPQQECHAGRFGPERAERAAAILRAATAESIQAWFDSGKPRNGQTGTQLSGSDEHRAVLLSRDHDLTVEHDTEPVRIERPNLPNESEGH